MLYHTLINQIKVNNFTQYPELLSEEKEMYATPNLGEIQEKESNIKGNSIKIINQVIQSNNIKLEFTNKTLDYILSPDACRFLNMCFTSYSSRLELTEILKEMKGYLKDFQGMSDFIVKQKINIGQPPKPITQGKTAPVTPDEPVTQDKPVTKKPRQDPIMPVQPHNNRDLLKKFNTRNKTVEKPGKSNITTFLIDSNLQKVINDLRIPETSDFKESKFKAVVSRKTYTRVFETTNLCACRWT